MRLHGPGWEAERLYRDCRDRIWSKPIGPVVVWALIAAGWVLLLALGSGMWIVTRCREIWYRCRRTPPERRVGYLPIRRYEDR